MKKQKKFQYVPCELRIAEFNVERGFAQTLVDAINEFTRVGNSRDWKLEDSDNDGNYANEGYLNQPFIWADENNPTK